MKSLLTLLKNEDNLVSKVNDFAENIVYYTNLMQNATCTIVQKKAMEDRDVSFVKMDKALKELNNTRKDIKRYLEDLRKYY